MLEKMGAMRNAYGEALVELGASNPRIVVLGADTTESMKSGMFGAKYPDRFFNLGIAEQNLVGVAAGLAFGGKVAYAGTYAIFVPGKCVDQIRNMLCYADLDVKIVCSHAGITVGPDGGSHEQVEDIALMRCVPHMRVVVPADAVAVKGIIKAIADIPGPFYVRITRGVIKGSNTPIVYENGFEYKLGKANVIREGGDVAIFGCGIMLPEAVRAAESLATKGIQASVIDIHTVKPIDQETIIKYAKKCGARRQRGGAQRHGRDGLGGRRGPHRPVPDTAQARRRQGHLRRERRGAGAPQQVRPDGRPHRGSGASRPSR